MDVICPFPVYSPELMSFNFKLQNLLLPVRERLSELQLNTSSLCTLCPAAQQRPAVETLEHYFFGCQANRDAGAAILTLLIGYDKTMSESKALCCTITCDKPSILILSCGLDLIYRRRKENKRTTRGDVKAELECLCSMLSRARTRKLREVARMVKNQLDNFL